MIATAAFLPPLTDTSPSSRAPPIIRNLSFISSLLRFAGPNGFPDVLFHQCPQPEQPAQFPLQPPFGAPNAHFPW